MGSTRKQFVQKWLRSQLIQLVNVQKCTLAQPSLRGEPEADLAVYTWAGVMVYVHLIDEPVKAAKVRRILENSTSTGIVSLFILDAELLPRQGEQVDNNKWFLTFPHLANDRAYTYHIGKEGPVIRPLQFIPAGRDTVETRYGPHIPITQLRYLRQTVKHSPVKGYWLIADFETELTARNPAFRGTGGWEKSWRSGGTANNGHDAGTVSRLADSYALLGVAKDASREDVKAAFRKLAFEVHPDVSSLPKDEAEARFKVLSEAYEYIRITKSWA